MSRVFSAIQPSGALHIGNYLGALRQWAASQGDNDCLFCVVDLHSMTLDYDPAALRERTLHSAIGALAAGLDPDVCRLFVQSHVDEHTYLTWILSCVATDGELRRMTQYKEKSKNKESVSAGLLTYPVLMAADILLYRTDFVPVGDDQRQHVELTRDVAIRFNSRFGETFVIPEATVPVAGARVMDLQHPERKMSKSVDSPLGTIGMLDEPEEITRKIRRAVTDTDGEMRYDPKAKPGLANLLDLLAAVTRRKPDEVAGDFEQYGPLKSALAEALVEELRPVRERYLALSADRGEVEAQLRKGADRARELAVPMLAACKQATGLLGF